MVLEYTFSISYRAARSTPPAVSEIFDANKAPTQLVIIMTVNANGSYPVSLCAHMHRLQYGTAPQHPTRAPSPTVCVAGISNSAAIAGRSCRASKFDSWARLGGIEVGTRCEGPAGRPTERLASQLAGQPARQASMQAGRQTGRQADRPFSQPAGKPANQPASQPAKGLTSTPDCLTQPPSALSTPLQISLIF